MSMDLTGTYGWFPRAGAFAGEFNRVAALYGSATDEGFQSIWSLFATSDQAAVQNYPDAVTTFRTTGGSYCGVLTADGQLASILQANRDDPLVPYDFPTSINRVRAQMIADGATINRPTIAGTVAYDGDNLGDTKVFFSNTNIYGDPLDMTLAEVLTLTCTSQGNSFNATFGLKGEPTVLTSAWNWPQGSGVQTSVSVVDPGASGGTITNSSLNTFTVANTPDSWTIIDGAAGTSVFEGTGDGVRSGNNAVYLLATGANTTKIAQAVTLQPNTVYAVTFQVKMNSNAAAGTLVVQLWNPAGSGAVLTNDAGDDLEVSYALNGGAGEVTTSYQLLTVFFSTPRQLPSTVQLRIGYGTAATSTRELYVCNVQVFQPTPLYGASNTGTYGPWVCAVANTEVSAVGDVATITVTNSLTTRSFALGLERIYSMRGQGVYLPSSGSPTISDSIVTH